MAPPLDSKQLDIINKEFYVNKNYSEEINYIK